MLLSGGLDSAAVLALGMIGMNRADAQKLPRVRIETTAGVIEAEIDTVVHVPRHGASR